jgi:LDH2 family malate/lactate/ureidoglycolate dehydrogenase
LLERFELQEKDIVRITERNLREMVVSIFEKSGVSQEDCRLAADALITADLRGVTSHGVSNLLRGYMEMYKYGLMNPKPQWHILRESPATASIDCDQGLGIIITPKAMEIAIEKARCVGIGMVTVMNGRHLGMASYHAMLALKYNMIGMCMTSTTPYMVPTFGAEARLGTNPIAVAVPADKEPPFVYDAATTVIANGKQILARRLGIKLLPGWVADANGTPIMEEVVPPPAGIDGVFPYIDRLLPLGSTREMGSHKGYGLAGVVEVFSSILTGGGYSAKNEKNNCNHCVVAYNIESFIDTTEFKRTMDEWLGMLKSTKPAPGHDRVVYPGQLEAEHEAECKAKGIPLHREVIEWFCSTCDDLHIPCTI